MYGAGSAVAIAWTSPDRARLEQPSKNRPAFVHALCAEEQDQVIGAGALDDEANSVIEPLVFDERNAGVLEWRSKRFGLGVVDAVALVRDIVASGDHQRRRGKVPEPDGERLAEQVIDLRTAGATDPQHDVKPRR